jgi:hypothetical protein
MNIKAERGWGIEQEHERKVGSWNKATTFDRGIAVNDRF